MANDRIQFEQKSDTAAGALSFVMAGVNQVHSIAVNIDALPTTSELLTITLNANAGSDHLVYSVDPSASTGSAWDLFWSPDQPFAVAEGDTITVAYTNTDANAVSVIANTVPF